MPDYTLQNPAYLVPEGAKFERFELDNIEATAATQVRVRLDRGIIDEYAEAMRNGAQFPPLHVFCEKNSERVILADGFHRHRAAINAKRGDIGCIVHEGGMHDALMYALGSNAEHGFRRSSADKRHAVEMALKDPELAELSNREIGDICRVSHTTVRRIRNDQLSKDSSNDKPKKKKKKPEKAKASDVRDNGKKLTQEEVETRELREALKMVTVLPYDGEDAIDRLILDPDLVADCEYVSTWLSTLVITYRNKEKENDGNSGDNKNVSDD